MPRFDYPPIPKQKAAAEQAAMPVTIQQSPEEEVFPSKWDREVRLPANAEILQSLQVGDEVEVTLRGKVTMLNSETSGGKPRAYLSVLTDSVEAYPEETMSGEEQFERSFDKGPRLLGRRNY